MSVEDRLNKLGLQLPPPPRPVGSYRPTLIAGGLLFISGQLPLVDGELKYQGRVGQDLTEAQAGEAARLAALNVLAQIKDALSGFDRLVTLVHVQGHVSSASNWINQPLVLDFASAVFNDVLGAKGAHTRSAFAASLLPLNASVELVVTAAVVPA